MSRAREAYEAHVGSLLAAIWKREGEFLVVDPADLNTPLVQVMSNEAGSTRVDPEWLPSDQQELRVMDREQLLALILHMLDERDEARGHVRRTMLDFLFAKGPDPLAVLERVFMLARAQHEGHDWNMNQTEMARLLGHSKQNWQHIEEKVITDLVNRFSRTEFVMSGGKSASAVKAYQEAQKGNSHRKKGRKAGDELPPFPPKIQSDEPLTSRAKRHAEMQRQDFERRRLAKLSGCDPDDIDLQRISPVD